MIREILIRNHTVTGLLNVTVYSTRAIEVDRRSYDNVSESSRKRLEEMISLFSTQVYVRKNGVAVWIAR